MIELKKLQHRCSHSFKNKEIQKEYREDYNKQSYKHMKKLTLILMIADFLLFAYYISSSFAQGTPIVIWKTYTYTIRVSAFVLNFLSTYFKKTRLFQGTFLILGLYMSACEGSVILKSGYYNLS